MLYIGSRFESCQWIIFLATTLILSPQIMTVHCTVVHCALCSMTVVQCALCSTVQYKNRVENGGPSKLFEFTFLPSWYRLNKYASFPIIEGQYIGWMTIKGLFSGPGWHMVNGVTFLMWLHTRQPITVPTREIGLTMGDHFSLFKGTVLPAW